MANFWTSYVCMISTVICMSLRGFWHLCNLPYVYALFWLISIARYFFKSPSICFRESKYGFYCEHHVAYFHSILWHQVRLWLELFASTVGRYLSQISHLPSYVFLQRRCSSILKNHIELCRDSYVSCCYLMELMFSQARCIDWLHDLWLFWYHMIQR